jgi:hypothetical protein
VVAEPLVRLRIIGGHPHVERGAREQEPHFGRLGRRLAVVGILLDEIARRYCTAPPLLVEAAVEDDALAGLQPDRAHRPPLAVVSLR